MIDGELSPQAIKQIIDAWESTDVFQYVRAKMAEEQAANVTADMPPTPLAPDVPAAPVDPAAGGAAADPATGAAPAAATPEGGPPDAAAAAPGGDAKPGDGPPAAKADGPPASPSDDSDDDKPESSKYRREVREIKVLYQKAIDEREAAVADKTAAESEVVRYRKDARDANRKGELSMLSLNYVLNVDEELTRADALSEAGFQDHLDTIVSRYQRIPIGGRGLLPTPVASDPLLAPTQDSEAAERAATAVRQIALSRGVTYEEAKILYRKEKGEGVVPAVSTALATAA